MTEQQVKDLREGIESHLEYDEAVTLAMGRFMETNDKLVAVVGAHPEWIEFIEENFDAIAKVTAIGVERNKGMLELCHRMQKMGYK